MPRKLDVEELLEKNPDAREVLEKNMQIIKGQEFTKTRNSVAGVGLPYGSRNVRPDEGRSEDKSEGRPTYAKF